MAWSGEDSLVQASFIEIDDETSTQRYLWRSKDFARAHQQVVGSYRALRKRLELRRANGLLRAGAVVETKYGLLIDPEKYREWVLQPRVCDQQSEVVDTYSVRKMAVLRTALLIERGTQ